MDKRYAIVYLQNIHNLPERRACALVGIARTTHRYQTKVAEDEAYLTRVVREYTDKYPHSGYRLLQITGYDVNHKRIERIWQREELQQLKRKAYKQRYGDGGDVKQRATYINHVWSYDFIEDRTENG